MIFDLYSVLHVFWLYQVLQLLNMGLPVCWFVFLWVKGYYVTKGFACLLVDLCFNQGTLISVLGAGIQA